MHVLMLFILLIYESTCFTPSDSEKFSQFIKKLLDHHRMKRRDASTGGGRMLEHAPRDRHTVVATLGMSLERFLTNQHVFLHDIETKLDDMTVKCEVSQVATSSSNVIVDWFCYHRKHLSFVYIPARTLEHLFTSPPMRGFLQKYNVTHFYHKGEDITMKPVVTTVTHDTWFITTIAALSALLLVISLSFIMVCLRRRIENKLNNTPIKHKSPGDVTTPFFSPPQQQQHCLAPGNKSSTPRFTFSSPTKFSQTGGSSVVLPQSPIETATPFAVQPHLDLLYPTPRSSGRPNSGGSQSSGGSRNKSLIQSRRGSSVSLVIDLSPTVATDCKFQLPCQSPTEEILLRKGNPVKYAEMERMKNDKHEIIEEFWSIPPNTISRGEDTQVKNSLKNRYPDILPNSRSIVNLVDADDRPVYINANFIKGYNGMPNQFIATQGPLPRTLGDFWLMVWQYQCSIIVMLTRLKERNKEKCTQYWPSEETMTQQKYGQIIVTFGSKIERDGYSAITMYASHQGSEEVRKITHFWFTGWPDHKVPAKLDEVVCLVSEVRRLNNNRPVLVHCSAGRGRTGCFIAILLGMNQIDAEKKCDVLKLVSQMRIERGGMVDKDHQYLFIYQALCKYWSLNRSANHDLFDEF